MHCVPSSPSIEHVGHVIFGCGLYYIFSVCPLLGACLFTTYTLVYCNCIHENITGTFFAHTPSQRVPDGDTHERGEENLDGETPKFKP